MISISAMQCQQSQPRAQAASVAKARGISTIDPSYTRKVFSVLQRRFGGTLTHHGFPGETASLQGPRTANRFSGDVQEGCTRLILEGTRESSELILRVTSNRNGNLLDVRVGMPAPTLADESIPENERQDLYDLQVLLGAAATAIEVLREWRHVEPACRHQIQAFLAEMAAIPDVENNIDEVTAAVVAQPSVIDDTEVIFIDDDTEDEPLEHSAPLDLTMPKTSLPVAPPQPLNPAVHVPVICLASPQKSVDASGNKRRLAADSQFGETSAPVKLLKNTVRPSVIMSASIPPRGQVREKNSPVMRGVNLTRGASSSLSRSAIA